MANLIEGNADDEMLRYEEAYNVKTYSGLTPETLRGGIVQHDSRRGVDVVFAELPSGGAVRIGEKQADPASIAQTDVEAMAQEQVAQAQDGIESVVSAKGPNAMPTMDDYLAAGYTEQQVRDFEAQRMEQFLQGEGAMASIQDPVTLTPDQIQQYAAQPGAETVAPREQSLRDRVQMSIFNAMDATEEPQSVTGKVISEGLQALTGSDLIDPEDKRFWSNYLTDLVDISAPGVGGAISADEGMRMFTEGWNNANPVDMLIGGALTGLGVAELVPIVKTLSAPAREALQTMSPTAKNVLADAIGASRAIAQGDKEMLLEVFQPSRPPQSLSAAAPTTLEDTLRQKYPEISIDLSGTAERGYELGRIVIPEGQRQSGVGTRVMQDMISMADEQGARIFLTPDTSFGGTSVSRLKDFYKRFGFVENKGKNKDFSTRNTMYRNPQPRNSPESAAGVDTSYRMQHQPRGPQDDTPIRLDDLTKSTTGEQAGYPEDFYSSNGPRFYAPGPQFAGDDFGKANAESYRAIRAVKGKPDAEVTIYRAVPNDPNITTINEGDFVTLSKTYAELHGASGYGRSGDEPGKVLSQKVKVKDIYWDGNDVNEFGYFPEAAATSSGSDILEMNIKANKKLADLFDTAGVGVDSPAEDIDAVLRRAGNAGIIDPRTAETIISGMKGQ